MTNKRILIRKARAKDHEIIWVIIKKVIASGDTYVFEPGTGREEMLNYWLGADKHTYVAEFDGKVMGTFILKDNFPGLGAHVANGSYMTMPGNFGKGIGRAMGEFSLDEARSLGYKAIQFNNVVKTNRRALKLWRSLGFAIKGEIPGAFDHKELGLVNTCIMWRRL